MQSKTVSALVTASLLLACQPESVSDLRREVHDLRDGLGAYQYLAIDPQLTFKVQEADFKAGEGAYTSPTLKYSLLVKQHNTAFPLDKYQVSVALEVVDPAGNVLTEVYAAGIVESGVLATSDVSTLYGMRELPSAADLAALKLSVSGYHWYPENRFLPCDSGSILEQSNAPLQTNRATRDR